MSEIDQQFIEYVVKSLVGKPDAVHIDRRIDEKGVLLELTVDPEDLGRVIGKRGATAQSLRTLLRALGTKNDARYNLKIIDNGTESRGSQSDSVASQAPPADDVQISDAQTSDEPVSTVDDEPLAAAETEAAPQPEPATLDDLDDDLDEETAPQEQNTSDRLQQTRKELADLDDLDV